MTTLFPQKETCFVCGNTSEHTVIGSTNAFGSPDLDLRPPEMQRSTITHRVQRCPTRATCRSPKNSIAPSFQRFSQGSDSSLGLQRLQGRNPAASASAEVA